jgi:lipopolysaccharide transport system ATP-binding protein
MVKALGVCKTFKLYRDPSDRLKEILFRKSYHHQHEALDDISFDVAEGETLGVIGPNGAGKSTLLKIITGVLMPDRGSVCIDGKVTGLLELGTGFNMELSGLKNIYMNAMLLGMDKEETAEKLKEIVSFAELADFIYEPMKTYSSGMIMRLGFAIALHAEPKCFVVDEALSVGDAYFQQKCMDRIKQFRDKGGSILFVSHDMNAIKILCDKVILLHKGRVLEEGDPEHVVNSYNFLLSQLGHNQNQTNLASDDKKAYGTFDAVIKKVSLTGDLSCSDTVSSGESVTIAVEFEAHRDLDEMTVGIMIRDKFGQDIFGTNTFQHQLPVAIKNQSKAVCNFHFEMNVGPGKYTITAALHTKGHHLDNCMHWADSFTSFEVAGMHGQPFAGICRLTPHIEFEGEVERCQR